MRANLRSRSRKWGLMLAATLCGGTTFTSCQTRFGQDIIDGTTNWIFSYFLNPGSDLYTNLLLGNAQTDGTEGT